MPRFLCWSDLHSEFEPFCLPSWGDLDGDIDGVLLAGDIDKGLKSLDFALRVHQTYDCPVVMVLGNHEYYNQNLQTFRAQCRERLEHYASLKLPIHLLDGSSVEIAGVRVAGATLWTDFELDPLHTSRARLLAARNMSDYTRIVVGRLPERHLAPEDVLAMHVADKESLLRILGEPFDGPTVVLSHHMPIRQGLGGRHAQHPLNAAFASDLLEELLPLHFSTWIYGHSHFGQEVTVDSPVGQKKFLTNPRGYPSEHGKTPFDPLRVLDLSN